MSIKIKAGDITNLTDARYFAAKEVAWMSFNFTESATNYITPIKAKAMIEWVQGPEIIGEFDFLSADEINAITENLSLNSVQVGMFTTAETISALEAPSVIKEFVIEQFTNIDFLKKEINFFKEVVDVFEINFAKNGITFESLYDSNSMITLGDLKSICDSYKIILNIDFQLNNMETLADLNVFGLTLKGGEEERIGVKSFDELDEIFDWLEQYARF